MIHLVILFNLIFAAPLIKVIQNPNPDRRLSSGGSAQKVIFKFNQAFSDNLLTSSSWFHHCMAGVKVLNDIGVEVAQIADGCDVDDVVAEMNKDGNIAVVEKDAVVHAVETVPNDSLFDDLWGMKKIDAPKAWDLKTGGDVVIAVIDTGIDYNHPDLVNNMWKNPGEIPGNGVDDDNNGYVDDVYGINTINGSGDPMDDNDHGTHCAGTIAGSGNNNLGVVGVMHTAKLLGCKFLDSYGSGSISDAFECVNYVKQYAPISSNSWAGGGFSGSMNDVLNNNPNHLFIAAAGNGDTDHDVWGGYPCDYNAVFCVASSTSSDEYSWFSDYGSTVDIAAPGSDILSTVVGGNYQYLSGTSMACPHVAGLAGLLLAYKSDLTKAAIKDVMRNTGDSITGKNTATNKRINAYKALLSVTDTNPQPTSSAPTPTSSDPTPSPTTPQPDSTSDWWPTWNPEPSTPDWQPEPTTPFWSSTWQPEPTTPDWQPEPTTPDWQPEPTTMPPTTTSDDGCFGVGDRVMLIPGSRYSDETDKCATLTKRMCPRSRWTKVKFDGGYSNFYQHRDLQGCQGLPVCQGNSGSWNAGWGLCSTYAAGQPNHSYCNSDKSEGLLAREVCGECGECEATESQLPDCNGDSSNFDAGWGPCSTYAFGQPNHNYCALDEFQGQKAEEICAECGECQESQSVSVKQASRRSNTRRNRRARRQDRRQRRRERRAARRARRAARRARRKQNRKMKPRNLLI